MQTDHVVCYVQVHGLNSNLPCLLNTVRKSAKCLSKKSPNLSTTHNVTPHDATSVTKIDLRKVSWLFPMEVSTHK